MPQRQLERVETRIHDAGVTNTGRDGASDDGIDDADIVFVTFIVVARTPTSSRADTTIINATTLVVKRVPA